MSASCKAKPLVDEAITTISQGLRCCLPCCAAVVAFSPHLSGRGWSAVTAGRSARAGESATWDSRRCWSWRTRAGREVRRAGCRLFCSGKQRRLGMNLQVISAPDGKILWVSGPLPGAVHDLTAARIWSIIRHLAGHPGRQGLPGRRRPDAHALSRPRKARLAERRQPRPRQAPRPASGPTPSSFLKERAAPRATGCPGL